MEGVYVGRGVWRGCLVGHKEEGGMCSIPPPQCHCASWSLAVALHLPPNSFLRPETFSSSCYLETNEGDDNRLKRFILHLPHMEINASALSNTAPASNEQKKINES